MLPTGSHPTLWSWLLHFIRYKFKLLIFVSFFFLAPLHKQYTTVKVCPAPKGISLPKYGMLKITLNL